jgi:DHA1 family inner membrane transport protein
MAFFRNSAVNLLNLHYGIHTVALSGGAAFFLIYLMKAGVPIPGIFVSIALVLLGRFIIRPFVVRLAVRCGLRAMVVLGTVLSAAQYPLLAEVHGVGGVLAALIVFSAVGDTIYWTTYHAYFAALSDDDHRAQQIGAREAIAAVIGVASPLLTGWMLLTFGPRVAFGTTAVIAATATVPLLWAPDVTVRRHVPGALRAGLPGMLLFAADGLIGAGNLLVWQIALFVSLGENVLGYGGAMALAALAGAIGGLTLGRHIDAGHGRRAVWYASGTLTLIIALRVAAAGHAAVAVLANALGSFGYCLYIPTMMTAVYTLAKQSPCTLRFHVATEGGWDLGGATGLLIAALATRLGLPLSNSILVALAGVVPMVVMLRRYYAKIPAIAVLAAVNAAANIDRTTGWLPHGPQEPEQYP